MDPDPDPLDVLTARPEYAAWRVWRGVNGTVYAWLLKSSPPVRVQDTTVAGLRARMDEFVRVYETTASREQALAAAEALDTSGLG